MRVSVTIHTADPTEGRGFGGNQRNSEARYQGFNRQHASVEVDNDGHGLVTFDTLSFPAVQDDGDGKPYCYFSLGVCEGVPQGAGGEIIIAGPITPPFTAGRGYSPELKKLVVGIDAERLKAIQNWIAAVNADPTSPPPR